MPHKSGPLQECLTRASVLQECATRASHNRVCPKCPTSVHKSVPQECSTRLFHKSARQEFPTRVSHKNVLHKSIPQECPARTSHKKAFYTSHKSVPQECPKRVSAKSVLQECPTRVSYKSVRFLPESFLHLAMASCGFHPNCSRSPWLAGSKHPKQDSTNCSLLTSKDINKDFSHRQDDAVEFSASLSCIMQP